MAEYHFVAGQGETVLDVYSNEDTILIDVEEAELIWTRNATNDLEISYTENDKVILQNFFDSAYVNIETVFDTVKVLNSSAGYDIYFVKEQLINANVKDATDFVGVDIKEGGLVIDGYSEKITGTAGDDVIYGNGGADKIYGGEGIDHIEGGEGNDYIEGGEGADYIDGGNGVDEIYGENGNDEIYGNAGNDKLYGGYGQDRLYGGADNDEIYGDENNDYIDGGSGADTIYGGYGIDEIHGGSGADEIYGENDNDEIYGDDGNDKIYGGEGADYIEGGTGADTIYGGVDNDTLSGGSGNDIFIFEAGDGVDTITDAQKGDVIRIDVVNAELTFTRNATDDLEISYTQDDKIILQNFFGADFVDVSTVFDTIKVLNSKGGYNTYSLKEQLVDVSVKEATDFTGVDIKQDEVIIGGYNEKITGTDGDDVIYANGGNDKIYAGSGVDYIEGGKGNDYIEGGDDNDIIYGNEGEDEIYGNDGNDEIHGGTGIDKIYGGAGNDEIYGGDDADEIYGGAGEDVIYGDDGGDVIYGGADNDDIYGGDGIDIIHGGQGDDYIEGGDNADTIYSEDGDDEIHGGNGGDYIYSGAGSDSIYGESGNNVFIFEAGDGEDVIYDAKNGDIIQIDVEDAQLTFTRNVTNDLEIGYTDSDKIVLKNFFANSFVNLETVFDTIKILNKKGEYNTISLRDQIINAYTQEDVVFNGVDIKYEGIFVNGYKEKVTGTEHTDFIYGNYGNDEIDGGAGNDRIYGGYGDDKLHGNLGNDIIEGGAGNDIINGGKGSDTLTGGTGENVFVFESGDGVDTITDVKKGDIIRINVLNANITLTRNISNDLEIGYTENDKIVLQNFFASEYVNQETVFDTIEILNSEEGYDTFSIANAIINATVNNDNIFTGVNIKKAGKVIGGYNEKVVGSEENDTIYGNYGVDDLRGEDGNDIIYGGVGNDYISGGAGDDIIYGDDGNDTIFAGPGTDTISGGSGNNIFIFHSGDGENTILDAKKEDIIRIAVSNADIICKRTLTDDLEIDYTENDKIILKDFFAATYVNKETVFDKLEILNSESGYDTYSIMDMIINCSVKPGIPFYGVDIKQNSQIIDGYKEKVTGTEIEDTIYGNYADDEINGGDGNDYIYGGNGNDILYGEEGDDSLYGNDGDDYIDGGEDADEIHGGAGSDEIYGGAGDDNIHGGTGNDVIYGNDGSDTFVFEAGDGEDVIYDAEKGDIIQIDVEDAKLTFTRNVTDDLEIAYTESDKIILKEFFANDVDINTVFDTIKVLKSAGGYDTLSLKNQIINAAVQQDKPFYGIDIKDGEEIVDGYKENITGTESVDKIYGKYGNDEIYGGKGADEIYGGAGDDNIHGGTGNDVIYGNDGDDELYGDIGSDEIHGGAGDDKIFGGKGDDELYSGEGNNTFVFEAGDGYDTLNNSTNNDTLQFENTTFDSLNFVRDDENLVIINASDRVTVSDFFTAESKLDTVQTVDNEGIVLEDKTILDDAWINVSISEDYTPTENYHEVIQTISSCSIINLSVNDKLDFSDKTFEELEFLRNKNDLIIVNNEIDTTIKDYFLNVEVLKEVIVDTSDVAPYTLGDATVYEYVDTNFDNITFIREENNLLISYNNTVIVKEDFFGAGNFDTLVTLNGDQKVKKSIINDGTIIVSDVSTYEGYDISETSGYKEKITVNYEPNVSYDIDGEIVTVHDDETGEYKSAVFGNCGNDTIYGSNKSDWLNGGKGSDVIYGGSYGNDMLLGGAGDDFLIGGGLNQDGSVTLNTTGVELYGNDGVDNLIGGKGNDILSGGADNDILTGNGGSNTFVFSEITGFGSDVITDATVNDTLQFALNDLSGYKKSELSFIKNGDNLLIKALKEEIESTIVVSDYYKLNEKHRVNNIIVLSEDGTALVNDKIVEDPEIDVYIEPGDSPRYKGSNADQGISAEDYFPPKGLTGVTIITGTGKNTIIGSSYNDTINGSKARILEVKEVAGTNKITSGKGADKFILDGTSSNTVSAGAGKNTVEITSSGVNKITLGNDANYVNAESGTNTIKAGNGSNTIDINGGKNTVTTGKSNDFITIVNGSNTVKSGSGNDRIEIQGGTNNINTGSGYNNVFVYDGSNTLTSGSQSDTYIITDGINTVKTSSGKDNITLNGGHNTLDAGAGNDIIEINGGQSKINAGTGDDVLRIKSTDGSLNITGGAGKDYYDMSNFDDILSTKNIIVNDASGANSLKLSNDYTPNNLSVYVDVTLNKKKAGVINGEWKLTNKGITEAEDITGVDFTGGNKSSMKISVGGASYIVDKNALKSIASEVANWMANNTGFTSTDTLLQKGSEAEVAGLLAQYDASSAKYVFNFK